MISLEKKFIYIHIPKTGGTSICEALKEYETPMLSQHAKLREYEKEGVDLNSFFKFTSVRNPWERMVSWYLFDQRDKPIIYKNSFNLFLNTISNQLNRDHNNSSQFSPQVDFIKKTDREIDIDFIIRFENLQEDFNGVYNKIGIPEITLPKLNVSGDSTNYKSYYSNYTKNFIGELYKDDIEYFKYVF